MAKKSIETGEACDNLPEAMQRYLAMQAYDGRGPGGNYIGRGGVTPYGSGILGGDQGPQGKVGELARLLDPNNVLISSSHSPFLMSFTECRYMATNWPKYDGSNHLLFARQSVYDILHKQRPGWLQD
jgi:hypothetical protein